MFKRLTESVCGMIVCIFLLCVLAKVYYYAPADTTFFFFYILIGLLVAGVVKAAEDCFNVFQELTQP